MSQAQKLYSLLSDGLPHRTDEIVREVYGEGMSLARVGARIWDIKKKYGVRIDGWHDKDQPTLYWYKMDLSNTSKEDAPRCGIVARSATALKPGDARRSIFPDSYKVQTVLFDNSGEAA